ncbi:type VI secretion system Vgr family protein [Marinospirillum perlucidum]|uniref:type VI secretion system Vgr family protein n=1 Tax=Marinospirillum perlucidum TaxID=1982602 RepID=UPI000DF2FCD9|nr:type VI secretion system tip protein TssI/VgrG [Marinospirillum perlucidum]
MANPDTRFTFEMSDSDTLFEVVSFKGHEALGQPFRFTLEVFSEEELTIKQLRGKKARLLLEAQGRSRDIWGVVAQGKVKAPLEDGYLYQLTLVPRLQRLSLIETNEIYLKHQLQDTLAQVLEEGELGSSDYDLGQLGGYRDWEYRCQFGETHLNFLQRICEREGVYYRFDHADDTDKVVFLDDIFQHVKAAEIELQYQPETGLVVEDDLGLLQVWTSQGEPLPKHITLKDYSSETPSVQIEGKASVDDEGFGHIYRYCDNLIDVDEAEKLAEVRAQEIAMQGEVFLGESRDVSLAPGLAFSVTGHFREADNGDFYAYTLEHEGFNPTFSRINPATQPAAYVNRLRALRSDVQFRPTPSAEKPRFHGVLHAIIDAEDEGKYANIDDEGRYKVILPFDRVHTPGEGQASWWIPMMQPSAGTGGGMHFPLLKGTEVLLSFIGGDPDRPVISGALPNTAQPSRVTSANKTRNEIHSASGNRIEMEDEEGKSRLKLFSPTNNSYLHLGAPNHDGDGVTITTDGLFRSESIGGMQKLRYAKDYTVDDKGVADFTVEAHGGEDGDTFDEQALFAFPKFSLDTAGSYSDADLTRDEELSGQYLITRLAGDQYTWTDGNTYTFGGSIDFGFGNADERSFFVGPDDDRYSHMTWDVPDKYTGATDWAFDENIKGTDTAWSPGDHLIEKVWGNTFNYQMGNNYSWGDTADYEFGNGYAETHVSDSGKINQKVGNDKANKGGPYFDSINGSNIQYSSPDNVIAEKTYGDTYEYRNGNLLEVHDGKAEAHHHGDSHDYHHGDSFEELYGLSKSIHHGRVEDFFMGGVVEMHLGAGKSINLNAMSEITAGLASEVFLGAQNEMAISVKNEMYLGLKTEISAGGKFTADGSSEMNAKVLEAEAKATEISNAATKLNNMMIEIKNQNAGITSRTTRINNIMASINNSGITMIN